MTDEPLSTDELTEAIRRAVGDSPTVDHLRSLLESANYFDLISARLRPTLMPPRSAKAAFTVRVDLDGAKPPIWRRIRLASDLNLERLHEVLQIAMGWTNSHLHHFQMGPDTRDIRAVPFLTDFDIEEGDTDGIHERDVTLDRVLAKPGQRLFYEYDFGDGWAHTIKLEKIDAWIDSAPEAVCVGGRRACPPEDVGGIPGYEEALAALGGDPGQDPMWTQQLLDWLPEGYDPERFDADEVNELLRMGPPDIVACHPGIAILLMRTGGPFSLAGPLVDAALGELPELSDDELAAASNPYRILLRRVADGLKLTQAGYMSPSVVRDLANALRPDEDWPFPPGRESDTRSILTLRESAIALGLLRKNRGDLLPTAVGKRVADDPSALFLHVRDRLPLGRSDAARDAGFLAMLFAAAGKDFYHCRDDAAVLMEALGWRIDGPMDLAVWWESEPTRNALAHLLGPKSDAVSRRRVAGALLAR